MYDIAYVGRMDKWHVHALWTMVGIFVESEYKAAGIDLCIAAIRS